MNLPGFRTNKPYPQRKIRLAAKLQLLLDEYCNHTIIIITINNVGSKQIDDMRKDFRYRARFLFGKNTLIRKIIKNYIKHTHNTKLLKLMEVIKGNCGLVFTRESANYLCKELKYRKKQCWAKAGMIAPVHVFIPPGPTGLEPTKRAIFKFQAMGIPTRINRGQIDIEEETHIIEKGTKIGVFEAELLTMLGIKPFYYGIKICRIYENGLLFCPHFMGQRFCSNCGMADYTEIVQQLTPIFYKGIRNVAALCNELKYKSMINVPYELCNAYRYVLSLGLELDAYSWDGLDVIRNNVFRQKMKSFLLSYERTTFKKVRVTIKCIDIERNIEQFVKSFWNYSMKRKNRINGDIEDVKTFVFNMDDMVDEKDENNYDIVYCSDYADIGAIEIVSKLLSGERNKDICDFLLDGYLRSFNMPLVINDLCRDYCGDMNIVYIKPLKLDWSDDLKKCVNGMNEVLIETIKRLNYKKLL